jgi:polyferredoxin
MRFDLTRFPVVKFLLKNRWPQLIIFILMLAGFLYAIMAGYIGTPVGNNNFGIVFVWIAWWAILILVAVPFFGRGWCAVCPIPMPGEWIQRGAILEPPSRKPRWLSLRWPNKFRNIWMQNLTFTLVALFSAVILTTPKVTAVVLTVMLFLAVGMSVVFERRTFCRYLCPVSGFIGLYAQTAPIELRVKEKQVCITCDGKPCYNGASTLRQAYGGASPSTGSAAGYGCPWDVFPGGLTKNTYCGLCMECLRTCPNDNIAVNLRPFAADLAQPSRKMDEAFKAFIMLGAAMVYAGVLLGPWGTLKAAAYSVGTGEWFGYVAAFLALIFGLLPALFLLAVKVGQGISKSNVPARHSFTAFATVLIPLGLMFWVGFSLSFVLTNASYILIALSDPFGWGWNLFGTAAVTWHPFLTATLVPLQILALLGGLLWSARTALKVSREVKVSSVPVVVFATLATLIMLGLLL